jgi:hypothetical protein
LPENLHRKYILKINEEPASASDEIQNQGEQIKLTEEVESKIKSMFEGIKLEDARRIIYEVTNEMIGDLKLDMRKTLKSRESVLVQEVSKLSTKQSKP